MRDEQVGQFQLALQILQEIDDLGLDGHIESRYRLVADDETRLQREGASDADALALPAGELMRITCGGRARQAHQIQHLEDRALPRDAITDAMNDVGLGDRIADRHPWIERAVGVLEDDLHLPPAPPELGPRQLRQIASLEKHRPGGRLDQAQQQAAGGRLAATGFADEAEGFARADREVDAVDGACPCGSIPEKPAPAAEDLRHAPRFDHGSECHARASSWGCSKPNGCTQAAAWSGETSPSRGGSRSQIS